jgi:hypothetical protein
MKRMRNTLPSGESQNPSTGTLVVASALPNDPVSAAPVNGLLPSGAVTLAVTSMKS